MRDVSSISVMTDVANMQVVHRKSYMSVVSKACPKVSPVTDGEVVEMEGTNREETFRVSSGPCCLACFCCACSWGVPGASFVDSWCRLSAGHGVMLVAAQRLRVTKCTVRGVKWLLRVGRHWGKDLSSVVMYLDCLVVVRCNLVWFGGELHPMEHFVFGH